MFDVVFFRTFAGNEPAREWLKELSKAEREVIGADLRTVQMGFPIGMPVCRPFGSGLYEVRSSLPSRREARLIFLVDGSRIVILSGFIKKSKSTPATEMRNAKARQSEYETNKRNATAS